ncbi:MAG: aspartate aminotransferase family protein [Halolamina sp.]
MDRGSHLFHKWGQGVNPDLPRIERAHDEFLVTADGEELVDAASGAAVVNLGHSVPGIEAVLREQAAELAYLSLSHFTHEAPAELASKLADRAPGDLTAAFFTNSGSEANESAFKLARSFHRATGNTEKSLVISRWQSYHGATLGALSATGNTSRRRGYEPLLTEGEHLSPAYPYRWEFSGTPKEQAKAAANELRETIRQRGPETVSAFIAEPVGGASLPAAAPHPAYYREVRDICDEYNVLFIADEVMTGFGRTGSLFAMEHFDVVPDILTLGKGLTSGYAPMSAVLVREHIAAEFDEGTGEFRHGHTFGGNPLSAAVGSFILDQYTDDVLAHGRERGAQLVDELSPLRSHPMVGDLRGKGLMVGVEFVADSETKAPFDPAENVSEKVYEAALDRGVYTYPGRGSVDGRAGDHLMLTPPLTSSAASISVIADAVTAAIDDVYRAQTR